MTEQEIRCPQCGSAECLPLINSDKQVCMDCDFVFIVRSV